MQRNAHKTLPEKWECNRVSVPGDPLHYNPLQCMVVIPLICVLEVPVANLGRDHRMSLSSLFVRFLIHSRQIAVSNFVMTGSLLNASGYIIHKSDCRKSYICSPVTSGLLN
jgi:hypothetical protein